MSCVLSCLLCLWGHGHMASPAEPVSSPVKQGSQHCWLRESGRAASLSWSTWAFANFSTKSPSPREALCPADLAVGRSRERVARAQGAASMRRPPKHAPLLCLLAGPPGPSGLRASVLLAVCREGHCLGLGPPIPCLLSVSDSFPPCPGSSFPPFLSFSVSLPHVRPSCPILTSPLIPALFLTFRDPLGAPVCSVLEPWHTPWAGGSDGGTAASPSQRPPRSRRQKDRTNRAQVSRGSGSSPGREAACTASWAAALCPVVLRQGLTLSKIIYWLIPHCT